MSCTVRVRPGSAGARTSGAVSQRVILGARSVTVHLQRGDAAHDGSLVLYATGDGGWRGKDRDVFRQMAAWGYTLAGFSAPEYLEHLSGEGGTTTPARLGLDMARLIDVTRDALLMPHSVSVTLVGVSRGADLMVVAAGQPGLRDDLAGVVAMGLTREEEYVRRGRQPEAALELYAYLPRLGDLPLSVIQSTRDRYLPAAEARVLFGSDSPVRRLSAVDARNHSFAGARPRLYALLRDSLAWVGQHAPPRGPR